MNDISDARVDELLREAEQRLQKGSVSSVVAAAPKAAGLISQVDNSATPTQSQPQDAVATTKEKLSVRTPQTKADAQRQKAKVSFPWTRPARLLPFVMKRSRMRQP